MKPGQCRDAPGSVPNAVNVDAWEPFLASKEVASFLSCRNVFQTSPVPGSFPWALHPHIRSLLLFSQGSRWWSSCIVFICLLYHIYAFASGFTNQDSTGWCYLLNDRTKVSSDYPIPPNACDILLISSYSFNFALFFCLSPCCPFLSSFSIPLPFTSLSLSPCLSPPLPPPRTS